MAKHKRIRAPPPRPSLPRNTVTLSLEGDEEQFAMNYRRCQSHLQYYFLCHSGCRVRYGERIYYTTPLDGTFNYVLQYAGRYLVFIIVARSAWLIGFCSANGFFQMRSTEFQGCYMDSEHTQIFKFNVNHKSISPDGTGSFVINLKSVRRKFNELCDYTGRSFSDDPLKLRANIGFFVIFIMEAKGIKIYNSHYNAILTGSNLTLEDDWVHRAIRNWQTISLQGLGSFDDVQYTPHDCGIRELEYLDDLLGVFFYLHVDSYFIGICKHDPMDAEPRIMTWDPVDQGVGDGDIQVLREPKQQSASWISCRGSRKRVSGKSELSVSERKSKKARGLCGGGLGGKPEAPPLFEIWANNNNKETCEALEAHLKLLGLTVRQSKRSHAQVRLKPLGIYTEGIADDVTVEEKCLCEKLETIVVEGTDTAASTSATDAATATTLPTDAAATTSAIDADASTSDTDATTASSTISSSMILSATDIATLGNGECLNDGTTERIPSELKWKPLDEYLHETAHVVAVDTDTTTTRANQIFSSSDIASLGDGKFLNDAVIGWDFNNLMISLEQKGIYDVLLVDPIVSYSLYHNAGDPEILNLLSSSRLALFPLNDNENAGQADGGTHWSLLVLDQWMHHGPRFLHYDSAGGSNIHVAHRLIQVLRPFLAHGTTDLVEGDTPHQGHAPNCGVFVISIARSICKWCAGATESEDRDWSLLLQKEVDAKSVASLRKSLQQELHRHL